VNGPIFPVTNDDTNDSPQLTGRPGHVARLPHGSTNQIIDFSPFLSYTLGGCSDILYARHIF